MSRNTPEFQLIRSARHEMHPSLGSHELTTAISFSCGKRHLELRGQAAGGSRGMGERDPHLAASLIRRLAKAEGLFQIPCTHPGLIWITDSIPQCNKYH